MFGVWVFDISPPPSHCALGQVFRLWDPICVQLLLASTGPEVLEASCCHDTNLLSSASSRAMARYTAESGITIKRKGKTDRERGGQGWRGSDGVVGDIMSVYAETQILDSALVCK